MKVPRLMLGAAALFWGVLSGQLLLAIALALALEASHWTTQRWEIAPAGFQRVADFCTWTFLLGAAYLTFSIGLPVPVLQILQWLPLVVAPLVLAQRYSTAGKVELSALFTSLRGTRSTRYGGIQVDLAIPFIIVCALAAGTANTRSPVYFAGVAALAVWALWSFRPRRRNGPSWVAAAAFAVFIGYAGHIGLARLQSALVNYAIEYLDLNLARTDPYRASTDIGHIGKLKLSDRILLRVTLPAGVRTPVLLHRASYDFYSGGTWLAREAPFEPILKASQPHRWLLQAGTPQATLIVRESMPDGRAVLALPAGAVDIAGLGEADIKHNRLGTVRIDGEPGAAAYRIGYAPTLLARDPPTPHDLRIPGAELQTLTELAAQLRLGTMAPAAASHAVQAYFAQSFRYSTYQAERSQAETPLQDFLLRTRSGHCEYFATATVLLARAAGIPARYATGFSVQEWSALENSYLVRDRHAHAWAQLYFGEAWHDVDTTPAQWFDDEAKEASALEPLSDLWSWLGWRIAQWRSGTQKGTLPTWALWALVPLVAVLVWRIRRAGGFVRRRKTRLAAPAHAWPGADSELYRIETLLASLDLARGAHEAWGEWLERVKRLRPELDVAQLQVLLMLHYRYRFDPAGLEATQRRALADGVEAWIAGMRGASHL